MTDVFRLSESAMATLAAGRSDHRILRLLRSAQLSKHLLLLRCIADAGPSQTDAFEVLASAHRSAPAAVGDLLASPFVGAWAVRCIRSAGLVDLSYVANLAAAAALRAGVDVALTVTVRDDVVFLPTVGSVVLPSTVASALVMVSGGRAVVCSETGSSADWREIRRLSADVNGHRSSVVFDDVDPYRDCYRMALPPAVGAKEFTTWEELFRAAWRLLALYDPAHAAELAGGLHTVVPLMRGSTDPDLSATSGDAIGALALTLPDEPASLAVTLVHEFQHSKLSALLELVPLYDESATAAFFAPWRRDPRPIGGLLQGAYAFLGVCEIWRRLRDCPSERVTATTEFAVLREQVRLALATLASSSLLTAHGQRFVAGMRAALRPMLDEALPAAVVASAHESLARNVEAWQRRNATSVPRQ